MSYISLKRALQMALMIAVVCGLSQFVQAAADLRVTVDVLDAVKFNEPFETSIIVENVGDDDATSVVVFIHGTAPDLELSSQYHFGSDDSVLFGSEDGTVIDVLPAGTTAHYSYSFIPTVVDGRFTISAGAYTSQTDPTPDDNYVFKTVTLDSSGSRPDLAVTMVAQQPSVSLNEIVTLVMTCTNIGSGPAPAVTIDLKLNQDQVYGRVVWKYVSGNSTEGRVADLGTRVVNQGIWLEPGESVTFTAEVKALWPGERSILVSVRDSKAQDSYELNDTAEATINVDGEFPVFDLQSSISMSPSVVQPGGLIVQQMNVTNSGPDDAIDVTLYTQVGDLTSPFGTIKDSGNFYLCDVLEAGPWSIFTQDHIFRAKLPFLAAGDSASVTLVMRVRDNLTTDTVSQHCSVASDWWFEGGVVPDPNWNIGDPIVPNPYLANNSVSQPVQINLTGAGEQSDLEVARIAPLEVPMGQAYTYRITAVNKGPFPTTTGKLGSIVPEGLTVVYVNGDRGHTNVAGRYVGLDDVTLAVGEAANLDITVVPQVLGAKLVQAGVAGGSFDPVYGNNLTAAVTLVKPDGPVVGGDLPCVDTPDLVLDFVKVKRHGKFKKKEQQWQYKIQAKVAVTNVGTACVRDRSDVKFYLSADSILDPNDLLVGSKKMKKICPAKKPGKAPKPKKLSIKQKIPLGVNPVGMYLLAVADGDNVIMECDESNNIGVNVE